MDWLYLLFLISAYAAIPGIPAAALRVKAPDAAYKTLVTAGTILGLFCLLVIVLSGDEMIEENEALALFAQCALISTVPVLYCAALVGKGKYIWFAAVPAATYFLGIFMRYLMAVGFWAMLSGVIFENAMGTALGMSIIFFVWALCCIFVTKIIYRFAKWIEMKRGSG
jgi:hypothetical protein